MFTMDFSCRDISWVGNISQKFETLCSELDDIMSEETIKYVEDQLQTVGADVKQLCAELVHDMLPSFSVDSIKEATPDLSLEHTKDTELVAHERSKIAVEDNPKKGICNVNSLPHLSFVEPAKGVQTDPSLNQDAEIGIYDQSNMDVVGDPVAEKSFASDTLEAVALPGKDSSMASSLCGVKQSNHEEGWNGQVYLSPIISAEWCNKSKKVGEPTNLVNTAVGTSCDLPWDKLIQSCGPDSELHSAESNDTCTTNVTVSVMESSWPGLQLCDEFGETEGFNFISIADSGEVEASDDYDIKLDLETTQPNNQLNLEESCIMVDSSEFCSLSLSTEKWHCMDKSRKTFFSEMTLAKGQESQQPFFNDLDAGITRSSQQEVESSTPSMVPSKFESLVNDFCEFEWEII